MTDFSGRKVATGIAKEPTRGTGVTPAFWLGWTSFDFDDMGKTTLNQSAINVLDENSGAEVTETWGGGKIEGIVPDESIGLLLYALMGSHAVAAHPAETIVYDHTFSESQTNTAQSVTITRKDPNLDQQFALAMLKTLELDVVTGEYVKFSSDWVSQPSTVGTDTTVFIQENNFISKDVVLKIAANTAGLTGALPVHAKDVKITVEKDVNPYYIIGQNNPDEIFAQKTTIKGDFTLRYSDATYKTLRFNNTPQAVSIDLKNSGITIGTSSHPEIVITLPKVYLTEWKVATPTDGMVEQTVTFEGTFDFGSAHAIQILLTNTVATY